MSPETNTAITGTRTATCSFQSPFSDGPDRHCGKALHDCRHAPYA